MCELLSPKLDVVFKTLFTRNQDLLKHFVSSMLSIPIESIADLVILNPEITPEEIEDKFSRLDLRLEFDDHHIDVEIQIRKMEEFRDRALFYWAKLFVSNLKAGETYDKVKKTISINLLDFNLFQGPRAHTEVVPVIKGTQEIFSDKMVMHFFELKKVGKLEKGKMKTAMRRWLEFFNVKNHSDLDKFKDDPVMNTAASKLDEISADARLRELARSREKSQHDAATELAGAERRGEKRGERRGKALAIVELFKEGSITLQTAMQKLNMSENEFRELCAETSS